MTAPVPPSDRPDWPSQQKHLKISSAAHEQLKEAARAISASVGRPVTYSEAIERLCALRERMENCP